MQTNLRDFKKSFQNDKAGAVFEAQIIMGQYPLKNKHKKWN